MNEKKKYHCFLQNVELLTKEFSFTPLLYGSLGLEVLTNSSLNADDIDILIPERFVRGEEWGVFRSFLEQQGYVLVDEHEHTFRKDAVDYSYASLEELERFAGIAVSDIPHHSCNGVEHLLLSLEQYLRVYSRSSQDGYRINVKEKQDLQKIAFIKEQLEK